MSSHASPENKSTIIAEIDGMPVVYVPAGEFLMGSDNGDEDQKPLHQVYLNAYWIDQHEVTNKQYAKCVTAGVCDDPTFSYNPYYFDPDKADYPLEGVFWSDADTYCRWAGRRLPTEAEWEKAARGSDGRTFPWGNTMPTRNLLNFNGSWNGTTPVGCYSPVGDSPYGVWDMSGNVYEWVYDRYQIDYYAVSSTSNPQGPDSGDERVVRGSDFNDFENDVRVTHRYGSDPSWWHSGFRCAASP